MNNNNSLQVARTILEQLGGEKVLSVMIGAHSFTADGNGLVFKFKAKARCGIKAIKVTLDPSDTYTVEFYSQKGAPSFAVKCEARYTDTMSEDLVSLVEEATGLVLSLGDCGGYLVIPQ